MFAFLPRSGVFKVLGFTVLPQANSPRAYAPGLSVSGLLGGDCVVAFGFESVNVFTLTTGNAWSVFE
jgi:hypothetical protein